MPPQPERTIAVGLGTVRAELAEARARALDAERGVLGWRIEGQQEELTRLRALVGVLQAQLLDAQQELARLRGERAQLRVDELIGSIAAALDRGAGALVGRSVSSARAEIKALLSVSGGQAGLTLAPPATAAPGALSTVSIELRPVPPDAAAGELDSALASVHRAILRLQYALEGVAGAEPAFAAASRLAGAPPGVTGLGAELAPLVKALAAAAVRGELAGPVAQFSALAAALGSPPAARELVGLTTALDAVSAAIGS